jgi:hypothetical protein
VPQAERSMSQYVSVGAISRGLAEPVGKFRDP